MKMKILISGASFAGLSTAFWMKQLGHQVTVVEIGIGLRTGGTAVDIKGNTVEIVKRMGLFELIKANRLGLERSEFKNADDVTVRTLVMRQPGEPGPDDEFEIEIERAAELLKAVNGSTSFYFDKLYQIRMPAWSKGRIALVGDAGYCPSPAAGMGGSLAIDGANALANAMRAHPSDFEAAFREYDARFRPFIDEVQAEAVRTGLETLLPRTEAAIRARNEQSGNAF